MVKRSRLNKKPKNGFVKRLKRKFPVVSVEEIGLGLAGTALGFAFPPASVLLIPAGAGLTVHGLRDLQTELGTKVHVVEVETPEVENEVVRHAKKKKA